MRDDPTFGDLRALRTRMMTWAKSLTRSGSNTEDLVQSALLKMLANRHRAPSLLADVDPWARLILLNEFRMALRTRRVSVSLDDVELVAPDNPETQTYCRQIMRMALGLEPSLLLDPDMGHRWEPSPKPFSPTERGKRWRARQELKWRAAA